MSGQPFKAGQATARWDHFRRANHFTSPRTGSRAGRVEFICATAKSLSIGTCKQLPMAMLLLKRANQCGGESSYAILCNQVSFIAALLADLDKEPVTPSTLEIHHIMFVMPWYCLARQRVQCILALIMDEFWGCPDMIQTFSWHPNKCGAKARCQLLSEQVRL